MSLYGPDGAEIASGFLDGEDGPLGEFGTQGPDGFVIDNRTGLDDELVGDATRTFIEENSAFGPMTMNYQYFTGAGTSLMTRTEFRAPGTIIEEIRLARHLAERDDDVGAVMGEMIGVSLAEGHELQHPDQKTQAVFEAIAENMDVEHILSEMYREWLIAGSLHTAMLFSRSVIEYEMNEKPKSETASVPLIGILAAENIRVLGTDAFGQGVLAYDPDNSKLRVWLMEYFDPGCSPARKAEMGRQDRVAAALFTEMIYVNPYEMDQPEATMGILWVINTSIVQRSTMPKGSWRYARPPLTKNFPLIEAKRLLNVMDFALLQGGSNFIVVAKKGSDKRPARPAEVNNLREVIRRSAKAGVIVGDHRLSFEIITPKLDELLNPVKRKLIGRKLAMALMRVADHGDEGSAEASGQELATYSRVMEWDRKVLGRHLRRNIFKAIVRRNPSLVKGPAHVWFPKIILAEGNFFTEFVLKLRDRGDIPRKWAVEAAGFNYEAGLAQRKRELEAGDDETLIPGTVPHTSPLQPGQAPQLNDNSQGRPPGAGEDPKAPAKKVIGKNSGETIKAWFDDDPQIDRVVRVGENTLALLEAYEDREIGRITGNERQAIDLTVPTQIATTLYVPVNPTFEVAEYKAVRLSDGLSVLLGTQRHTEAVVAKVLCFREPEWNLHTAEDAALRWGFKTSELEYEPMEGFEVEDAKSLVARLTAWLSRNDS